MRKPSATGRETKAWNKGGAGKASATANESDPLLSQPSAASYSRTAASSNIRSRRASGSRSPNQHFTTVEEDMSRTHEVDSIGKEIQQSYNILPDDTSKSANASLGEESQSSSQSGGGRRSVHQFGRHYVARGSGSGNGDRPPLLEIPEEIYGVRKSALQVLKPLTRTWVSR